MDKKFCLPVTLGGCMAINCPVCTKEFKVPAVNGVGFLGNQKCDFCKTVFSIRREASGEYEINDIEWEEVTADIALNEHIIRTKQNEIETALNDDPENEDLLGKQKELEQQYHRLLEEREAKYDEYDDRQVEWEEKYTFRNE